MANFSTYGHIFEFNDRYAEGHPLTANEAAALNNLMGEFISHKVRRLLSDKGYAKGASLTDPEHIAEATKLLEEEVASFEFGAGRGSGSPRELLSPVEKVARDLATKEVRAAIAASDQFSKVGKKDGSDADQPGIYHFERFKAKVLEVAAKEQIKAAAKKIVAQSEKADVGDFDL